MTFYFCKYILALMGKVKTPDYENIITKNGKKLSSNWIESKISEKLKHLNGKGEDLLLLHTDITPKISLVEIVLICELMRNKWNNFGNPNLQIFFCFPYKACIWHRVL